ncbi:Nnf1-domain-containing protein [Geopyxis carbonaria]|nr:Nnf1-domain-containing protein [Geopyxis carbonaria]
MSDPTPQPQAPHPPPSDAPVPAPATEPAPTPEPALEEGLRAQQLRKVFTRALGKSVGTCSYENFAQCFPTFAKNRPAQCQYVWEQMIKHWQERAWFEYHAILAERGVVKGLNELDQLIADAEERRRTAPPGFEPVAPSMLPPAAVVDAHLTPLLQAAAEKVNGRLEAVQADNDRLMRDIERQRAEMKGLYEKLLEVGANFEAAVETVASAVGSAEQFAAEIGELPGGA